ncbi:MAG: GNAT family N-acetyltransferase [Anaerolineae bacterium]|nr:GNAT family N-acetyltransferase [Anaerolineae bacterium]
MSEADIQFFKPMVRNALPHIVQLAYMRDADGHVAGYIAAVEGKVEMLFIHPDARGLGVGKRLLAYAISVFNATMLDVNEQTDKSS